MNILKTTKMNSKILMVMPLAYFLVNLSTAKPQLKSLDLNNTPAQSNKILAPNQPIKINHLPSVLGNFKGNLGVPHKIPAQPAPRTPPAVNSAPPAPRTPPSAHKFLPIIKNENENHQGFEVSEEDDDYEDEEEEEENLENSKTVTSQPMLSSSTSMPTVPGINQKNDNHQEFETFEDDEVEEEEIEDEDHEEPSENSKIVMSQPMLSSSTSKPTVPGVNQKNDNHQEFETFEDDEVEEEEIEDEDHEEPSENSKIVTSQPMLSSLTSKPTVPESLNQENDKHQGFKTLEGEDDVEVSEENEYGNSAEEYSNDPNHKTPTDYIMINGVQVNPSAPMNNLISTVPQMSENALTENNYKKSEYPLNTNEDPQALHNYDEWESESSNFKNISPKISETLNRKNDNTKDKSINLNEFEISDNTQTFTDKQEETKEDQFNNQYLTENKERIINSYKAMKKILYMLHDYASSTFNWIINKLDYRMEQVSS